ncbi:MAG: peptidase S8 and S53 subtilisin kexin sedolisin [Gammaproteobacteria bacterium]|nr:peptidase S8 and S53 subtilisin kexin sedolisin [Gammaproteobacteria bacterium]NDA15275.1 peptidase S8 and S53 subtilisin kexin sedolisin [Gammaproteobacteria bacterium]NDG44489.1 peptidase S8 and S53 subtilisin kexin sedolisin [Gammaproteobacteria bacterium]
MKRIDARNFSFALTMLGLVVGFGPHSVGADELKPASQETPIIVYTRQAPGPDEDGPGRMLLEQVEEGKTVRVIAGVDFDMVAPHELVASDVGAQARDLEAMQSAVIRRVFEAGETQGVLWKFKDIPFLTLEVTRAELRRLLLDPQVVTVQEDGVSQSMLKESTDVIQVDKVWHGRPTLRGQGQVVAVLDTGTNHDVLLKGRVVAGACFSTNYWYYPSESLCSGRVRAQTGLSAGRNCATTISGCDHGTHVATIAAGASDSLQGVAPEAGVIRVQVFSKFTSTYWCGGRAPCVMSFGSDQIRGLEYVYSLRNTFDIAAVNMSLGGGYYASACDRAAPAIASIINRLTGAGIAVVIAAGNSGSDGYISYPACIQNAIAVGSSNKSDGLSRFSNHSTLIDLLAPGEGITAGVPSRAYRSMSGTSMAAPHVAGAFAVLRSYDPNASVAEIWTALACTGEPIVRGGVSRNRIDLRSALEFLKNKMGSCAKKEDSSAPDWMPRHGWF